MRLLKELQITSNLLTDLTERNFEMKWLSKKTRERVDVSVENAVLFLLGAMLGLLALGIVFMVVLFQLFSN